MIIVKRLLSGVMVLLSVIFFGIFIYPGIYKYDKLAQNYPVKINKITGTTQILRGDGWQTIEDRKETLIETPKESEMQALRNELYSALQKDRESVKNDIINEIKNDIISKVQVELNAVKDEITEYKKFETDPDNYFTIGSTKDEVKKIMGSPTSIDKLMNEVWWYDVSYITFENGKVSAYSNNGNLRVK